MTLITIDNGYLSECIELAKLAERKRIIELLKEQNVIRNCGATGKLVFVNCNTLEVLYLKEISDE
jgi:hypothetical protein